MDGVWGMVCEVNSVGCRSVVGCGVWDVECVVWCGMCGVWCEVSGVCDAG